MGGKMLNASVNQLIGKKIGCLKILGDSEHYLNNLEPNDLNRLKKEFEIQKQFNKKLYICKCVKCGNIYLLTESSILKYKRKRYCSNECFDEEIIEKYKDYDVDYADSIHESLIIKECVNNNYVYHQWLEKKQESKKRIRHTKICKKYRCECYLCHKEYIFKSTDFEINNDTYGANATQGYYCNAHCSCHPLSSFQWRTIKIFKEHNINYRVEYFFVDLLGIYGLKPLRFDFAIFNQDYNVKYLVECQGEQHYHSVQKFGGDKSFRAQQKNDELKRNYAKKHKICLIEIPNTCNTLERELKFLKSKEII